MQHACGDEREREQLEEQLKDAAEALTDSGQSAVSLTDPDARFMKDKKNRIELSYNAQLTVDHDSWIIVASEVAQACTDQDQLEPQVEQTERNVG